MGGCLRSASRVFLAVYRAAAPRAAAEPSRAGPTQPRLCAGEDAWERREADLGRGWARALEVSRWAAAVASAGEGREVMRVHRSGCANLPNQTETGLSVRGYCV
jgi:hypothetical protein